MSLPDRPTLMNALIVVVSSPALRGGDESRPPVLSGSTYEPLADFFGLTPEERTASASGPGGKPDWIVKVGGARQSLREKGWLEAPDGNRRQTWRPTEEGVRRARVLARELGGHPRIGSLLDAPLAVDPQRQREASGLPRPREAEQPLLMILVFGRGPRPSLEPQEVYEPLGGYFDLSAESRSALGEDSPDRGPLWHNVVQNARKLLVERGHLEPMQVSGTGKWMPSRAGIVEAERLAASYRSHPRAAWLGL